MQKFLWCSAKLVLQRIAWGHKWPGTRISTSQHFKVNMCINPHTSRRHIPVSQLQHERPSASISRRGHAGVQPLLAGQELSTSGNVPMFTPSLLVLHRKYTSCMVVHILNTDVDLADLVSLDNFKYLPPYSPNRASPPPASPKRVKPARADEE